MYQQNYSTYCTFLKRSLLSCMFVNIALCTDVFFLSCYMLLFHCCDNTWWRRQLIKEISYFDLWFQKVRAHHWWGCLTVSSRPGIKSWELRGHIFKRQREERTRSGVRVSGGPKDHPQWDTFLITVVPPQNLPEQCHQPRNNLSDTNDDREHFSSKPPHLLNHSLLFCLSDYLARLSDTRSDNSNDSFSLKLEILSLSNTASVGIWGEKSFTDAAGEVPAEVWGRELVVSQRYRSTP